MHPSRVQLTTLTGPAINLKAWLGPNGSVVTEGYGGWNVVSRPRAAGIVFWGGKAPFKMTLQLVIDGYMQDRSVEHECFKLERMALPADESSTPPIVDIDGAAVQKTTTRWVIDGLDWQDVERDEHGQRLRQVVTVTLIQHVVDARMKASKRAKGKAQTAKAKASPRQIRPPGHTA